MASITVDGVTKRLGSTIAVRNVSFAVEPGEHVGLFGPNGAGKTTLMQMLSSLSFPSEGQIRIGGSEVTPDATDVRRSLGVVGHRPMVYGTLTARENLRLHARLRGVDTDRVEAVLGQVNLRTRASTRVETFSHGMTKRLAIARSVLHDPTVLLLDEPYAGLDQRSAADLQAILEQFDDRTVVLATHDLQRGAADCDRALVLVDGVISRDVRIDGPDTDALETAYDRAIDPAGSR
ncbi:ABC transporter ATP-binding protein [Natronococcus jeotgali]|uniref:ABC-type transport system ATP-binding protein n=1 Tax=Natronococcus jeotgali DSM 18795 TaxID=1227498 RepID=L9XQE7_9EURY|nr:ABC transporter ATP-binding protein [Natronococcus jeotgali]ELY64009.1 ABC-type transport system ATP-binding protein [Natronococcus jeotgali DSM 18795]